MFSTSKAPGGNDCIGPSHETPQCAQPHNPGKIVVYTVSILSLTYTIYDLHVHSLLNKNGGSAIMLSYMYCNDRPGNHNCEYIL